MSQIFGWKSISQTRRSFGNRIFSPNLELLKMNLKILDPIQCVFCPNKFSYNVLPTISQPKTEDEAMQFLRDLNQQYINVTSHVLLLNPIPSISNMLFTARDIS